MSGRVFLQDCCEVVLGMKELTGCILPPWTDVGDGCFSWVGLFGLFLRPGSLLRSPLRLNLPVDRLRSPDRSFPPPLPLRLNLLVEEIQND